MAKRPARGPLSDSLRGSVRASTVDQDAQKRLTQLLAEKMRRAEHRHGAQQVAMAIAASTRRVKLDASGEAVAIEPAHLLDRTFGDPQVGIDRRGMASFKAHLTTLLPEIAADVRAIPEDPALGIADIVKYVTLSSAASDRPAEARARLGGVTVLASGALRRAREHVRDRFGSHFAAKCSDAALMAMGREGAREVTARPMAAAAAARRSVATPLIVELAEIAARTAPAADSPARVARLREAARLEDREAPHRRVGASQVLRQTRMIEWRDAFYKSVAPISPRLAGGPASIRDVRRGDLGACSTCAGSTSPFGRLPRQERWPRLRPTGRSIASICRGG
jgi:hypothetical protein